MENYTIINKNIRMGAMFLHSHNYTATFAPPEYSIKVYYIIYAIIAYTHTHKTWSALGLTDEEPYLHVQPMYFMRRNST